MECLLANGADVNRHSISGVSPLHFACVNGQASAVLLLLRHNAVYASDNKGSYPIESAIDTEHYEAIIPLLDHFPQVIHSMMELVSKDSVEEDKVCVRVYHISPSEREHNSSYSIVWWYVLKLLTAIRYVSKEKGCISIIMDSLAEIATNSGLRLLSSHCIIDVEFFSLNRAVNLLASLAELASREDIRRTKQVTLVLKSCQAVRYLWINPE